MMHFGGPGGRWGKENSTPPLSHCLEPPQGRVLWPVAGYRSRGRGQGRRLGLRRGGRRASGRRRVSRLRRQRVWPRRQQGGRSWRTAAS